MSTENSASSGQNAIVIDGNAVIHRAFHAAKSKCEGDEVILHAYSIIEAMCKSFLDEFKIAYDYRVVVFDCTKDTFRRREFPEYKANRAETDPLLIKGMEKFRTALTNFFVPVPAPAPFEGDDAICTLARIFSSRMVKTKIFTSDRDMLQLVSYLNSVILIGGSMRKRQDNNFENFEDVNDGLLPYQIPHLKALEGDDSDNYGGIEGIGRKTALKILKENRTIKDLYKNIDSIEEKYRKKLLGKEKELNMFLNLATTRSNLEISENLEDYVFVQKSRGNSR